jgi:hypothetical protein
MRVASRTVTSSAGERREAGSIEVCKQQQQQHQQ